MRSRILLALGLATALRGVPSFASAAGATAPEPSPRDGAVVPIVAGAAAISVAGIVLLVSRSRRPGTDPSATAEAERAIEAADDKVTAALQRRTLRRGRMRVDDESGDPVQRSSPPRRSG
jgi:hypothetical protein